MIIASQSSIFGTALELKALSQPVVHQTKAVQSLAQTQQAVETTTAANAETYVPLYKSDDPYGIALMLLGLFMIPFS